MSLPVYRYLCIHVFEETGNYLFKRPHVLQVVYVWSSLPKF